MIKAVILDWSGVVSNDWEATFATSNDVLEERGHPRLSEEKFRELYEMPWMRFYKKLGIKIVVQEEYDKWERLFPKYYPLVKAFPFAKKAMEWLKQHNKKILIFSAHNQTLLEKEIENYGMKELIDCVDTSHEDKRKKIEAIVLRHKIEKESTLYVGDMVHDVETAQQEGIRSVAVLCGYDSKKKLEKAKPDFIIQDIGELPELIEKLEAKE